MSIDDIDFSDLPADREAAFIRFMDALEEGFVRDRNSDISVNSDNNGNYSGYHEPERLYVTTALAFLDEYSIDADVYDISDMEDNTFIRNFGQFRSKLKYLFTRYRIRQGLSGYSVPATELSLESDFRTEISSHLVKIKRIVNQNIPDENKRDKIFKKISKLQDEIDRNRTTIDAMVVRMLDLSNALGQSAENLDPAIERMERIKRIFWDHGKAVGQLPKPDRTKLIEKKDAPYSDSSDSDDDEIPF